MAVATEERYLTLAEVGAHFGVNAETVRRWVQTGRIRAVQPGGPNTKVFIPRGEIARIEGQAHQAS